MKAIDKLHEGLDPFASRLFGAVKKNKQFSYILIIVAGLHVVPFIYLKISYPRDRVVPRPAPKVILWAPEIVPPSLREQMDFISVFRDPASLMLPAPYKVQRTSEKPVSRLPKLQPTPTPIVSLAALSDVKAQQSESLTARALSALNPLRRQFVVFKPITMDSIPNRTQVIFTPSIRDRVRQPLPELPSAQVLMLNQTFPTQLRIAIDRDGRLRHALIAAGSGSDKLDQQALELIRNFRFTKLSDNESKALVWGDVKFFWAFQASENVTNHDSTAP
ncbi:MAG: energy transducer TonB [Methylacidiphilales bacterium]|nr:energy transducer TonB [Candidatus Methylacidiphilales bacterium]MDW8350031.1 energy transducer TonB [Verrucomicrobiae bacterium]